MKVRIEDFPDVDELKEGQKYPDRLYLDSEWMQELFQVYVYAEGLEIEFRRPGHNLEIIVSTKKSKESIATVDGDTIVFTNEEEFEKTCKATEELITRFDEEFGDKENLDEDN